MPPEQQSPPVRSSQSPQQQRQQNEENPQGKENELRKNIVTCGRRCALWFKAVYLRKEYVPGDTCRFIWQTVPEVRKSFVYYRVGHMLANLFVLCISLFHIFSPYKKYLCETEPVILCFGSVVRLQFEWLFYATSIGLMFNLTQSIYGLVLTLQTYCREKRALKKARDEENRGGSDANPSATKEHKILSKTGFYWGLHSYSICSSVLIDVVYWTLVWPGPTFYFSQFNEHGINLPVMIVDYCVVAFPVNLSHLWFTSIISAAYIFVNFLWYISGGRNGDRLHHYLYPFLDWKNKPVKAVTYGVFISFSVGLFLMILLVVDHYKFKWRSKVLLNITQKNSRSS